MSDSRRQPRVTLPTVARIDLGSHTVPCVLLNLSEGGLAVLTDAGEQVTGPMQVHFRLGGQDAGTATIDAKLVNRRDNVAGRTSVWGLEALPMDLGTRTRVRDLVLRLQAA